MSREVTVLTKETNRLLDVFPDTIWPMPHPHRRLARLLLHLPEPRMRDINHAIEYLDAAHAAMRGWNNDEPRPITLALLLDMLTAHSEALKTIHAEVVGWKNDPRTISHLSQASETLDTAREDVRELFGRDGGVMVDLVEKWGRKLERLEKAVGV